MANKIASQLSSKFSELPPWAKGVVGVGGLLVVGFIVYKVFKRLSSTEATDRAEAAAVEDELSEELKKTRLTFPESQYRSFAGTIETAGFDVGTDEDAIYNVFGKLKNNADYLALTQAWGKPNRRVYEWGIGRDMTLAQFIRYEMNDKEVRKINGILSSKGIKYRI
jgi:hypothetical protein